MIDPGRSVAMDLRQRVNGFCEQIGNGIGQRGEEPVVGRSAGHGQESRFLGISANTLTVFASLKHFPLTSPAGETRIARDVSPRNSNDSQTLLSLSNFHSFTI